MIRWLTIVLAAAGLGLGAYAVATNDADRAPAPPPASPPSVNPFSSGLAASGVIEAASRNVPIGLPEGGLVIEVMAGVGERVERGQPLVQLDDRPLRAELIRAEAQVKVAEAELARLRAQPRAEELPALEAGVARARVRLADAEDQFKEMMGAKERGAISPTEVGRRRFSVEAARAEVAQAEAELALVKAGAWASDVIVAEARLAAAVAEIEALRVRKDRLTIRSPMAGTVLKRGVEPGQFAGGSASMASMSQPAEAAMVVGDVSSLRVRARVDEEDAPLLRDGARGVARVRGLVPEDLTLTMLWIEPLAQPKVDLLGTTTERVDTRVVEVMFRVEPGFRSRLFPGQSVDVFIETASGSGG